jgi:hypothetical protein
MTDVPDGFDRERERERERCGGRGSGGSILESSNLKQKLKI